MLEIYFGRGKVYILTYCSVVCSHSQPAFVRNAMQFCHWKSFEDLKFMSAESSQSVGITMLCRHVYCPGRRR